MTSRDSGTRQASCSVLAHHLQRFVLEPAIHRAQFPPQENEGNATDSKEQIHIRGARVEMLRKSHVEDERQGEYETHKEVGLCLVW